MYITIFKKRAYMYPLSTTQRGIPIVPSRASQPTETNTTEAESQSTEQTGLDRFLSGCYSILRLVGIFLLALFGTALIIGIPMLPVFID